MVKHFLLTIFRQLRRKQGFYALNIFGLSTGIAAFVLMFEYASYELSFDDFHKDASNLYRVNFNYRLNGNAPYEGAAAFAGLGPAMEAELPVVEATTRLVSIWGGGGIVRFEEKRLKAVEIQYAESSLFEIFSFEVLEGNKASALDGVHTAMLSEPMHQKLFEGESGIGKTVEVLTRDGLQNYLITGVYRVPENTHYVSDVLLSFPSLEHLLGFSLGSHWAWFDYITYVKLRQGTDPAEVEAQFPAMIDKYATGRNRNSQSMGFELMPVTDIHLHSHINQEIRANGDYQTVLFLLIIAVLVLSIAWINYVNLYTAQATERGKEVGIRKTLGSGRKLIAIQLMLEAMFINLLSVLLALFLVHLAMPLLDSYLNMKLPDNLFSSTGFWGRVILLWLTGSLLSGIYPAIMVSGFSPLKALKSISMQSSGRMRRSLVVWQFMASAGLIIGASTVYHQLTEMNAQSTGINTDQVMVINAPQFRGEAHDYYQSLNQLKNSCLSYPGVAEAAFASDVPGKVVGWRGGSRLVGKEEEQASGLIYKMVIGQDYMDLYNIPLLAGRNFERASDTTSVMLNETALSLYDFETAEDALGKRIFFAGVDTLQVIGVVKDYHQESLKEAIKPTAFLQMEEELMYIFIRLSDEKLSEFVSYAEGAFTEAFPELTFDWQLLEDQMDLRHAGEKSFLKAFNLFVVLSLAISALGLVGLAAFLARKRQKEMGLRKVLGSSNSAVLLLFLKGFVRLAIIGNCLVLPFAVFFANQWLDQFAFRTNFLWWLPLIAILMSCVLAFLATLHHVLKIARLNPVKVLSHE